MLHLGYEHDKNDSVETDVMLLCGETFSNTYYQMKYKERK